MLGSGSLWSPSVSKAYRFVPSLRAIPISFEELARLPVGRAAKRDGLSFKPTKNTHWILIDLDGDQVGVGALIEAGKKSRLKSVYIVPEWRRQGFFTWMALQVVLTARWRGYTEMEAIVRPASKAALLASGWESDEVKTNRVWCNPQTLVKDGEGATEAFCRLMGVDGTQALP